MAGSCTQSPLQSHPIPALLPNGGISARGRDLIQCKAAPDVHTELCESPALPCSAHPREGAWSPLHSLQTCAVFPSHLRMLLVPVLALSHTAAFSASSTGIMSLSGNSLLLLVAHQKRSLLKPAEFFIVNLAISDLSMTVTLFPLATSFFAHRYLRGLLLHWQSGDLWQVQRHRGTCKLPDSHPRVSVRCSLFLQLLTLPKGFGGGCLSWHCSGGSCCGSGCTFGML